MGKSVDFHSQFTIFDAEKESCLNQFEETIEKIQEQLVKFGLTANQAKVYIFLGKHGSKTASQVNKALKLPRTETYQILTALQNKGIVSATYQHPIRFSALPLTNAIRSILDKEKERINRLENQESELVELWDSITIQNICIEPAEEKFQVLQNENQINVKIKEMIASSKGIMILGTEKDFASFYHANILDMINSTPYRLLTTLERSSYIFEKLNMKNIRRIEINNLCFAVNDDQVLFYTNNHNAGITSAVWTNSSTMIYSKKLLFELLWKRSGE